MPSAGFTKINDHQALLIAGEDGLKLLANCPLCKPQDTAGFLTAAALTAVSSLRAAEAELKIPLAL